MATLLLTVAACASPPPWPRAIHEPLDQGPAVDSTTPTLAPDRAAPAAFVELPLDGAFPAVVSEPRDARAASPVLVATHGAGGVCEVHCEIWRTIVGSHGFIICPRGTPMNPNRDAFFYDGHPALAREITLALAALAERYGRRVDLDAPIFAGYSQGASMGAMMLPRHPAGFARAALIEGGYGAYQEWNIAVARRFREAGGQRVLIGCGRMSCRDQGRRTASYLERAGLETRLVYATVGHWFGDALYDEVRENFAWLVADDPRW